MFSTPFGIDSATHCFEVQSQLGVFFLIFVNVQVHMGPHRAGYVPKQSVGSKVLNNRNVRQPESLELKMICMNINVCVLPKSVVMGTIDSH